MFQLFRRHQKILLTSIAMLAIGSMAFSAIAPLFLEQKKEDPLAKEGLIRQTDQGLICLFNHSLDAASGELVYPESLFSDTLLETGILEQSYFSLKEVVDSELEPIFETIKAYHPPEVMTGLYYFDLIKQISPKLYQALSDLKSAEGAERIACLKQFFLEKNKLPIPLLYQYFQTISKGQLLVDKEDLYFFGLKNPEDFFGRSLIQKSTQYLISALKTEAKKQKSQALLSDLGQKLSAFYGSAVHPNRFFIALGLSPECGLEVFQVLVALKQLKSEVKTAILLDPLAYGAFCEFSSEYIPVNKYCFDKDLEPKTLEEALYLELYDHLKDPLIYDRYQLKVKSIDKLQVVKKLSKKELYTAALNDYSTLSELMPYALNKEVVQEKQRLDALKMLSGKNREVLEKHMQKAFAVQDPQFFQKKLRALSEEPMQLVIAKQAKKSPLPGFSGMEQLKQELEMLPLNTPVIFEVGENYLYEIELVSKELDLCKMSYQDALASGFLKEMLKIELEGVYKETLKKSPAKLSSKQKSLKTFDEAFEDLMKWYAKDLITSMGESLGITAELMPHLMLKGYPKMILAKNKSGDFRVHQTTTAIYRHDPFYAELKDLFDAKEGAFSNVILMPNGSYAMFEKIGVTQMGEKVLDKQAIEVLAEEKIKHYFKQS